MTLIEALVVMALTVLIGAIAFPRLDPGIDRMRLMQATAIVAADLRRSRAEAQRLGRSDFRATADGASYAIGAGPPVTMPAGTRVSLDGGRPLAFFADGSSSGGHILIADAGQRVRLDVAAATGLVAAGQR